MKIRVCGTRAEMGRASATVAADALVEAISKHGRVAVVLASAVSQSEFLEALTADRRVNWSEITAFHLDEYVGISAQHPASFRRFQMDRVFSRVTPAEFHQLGGDAPDIDAEVARYTKLLQEDPPSIGFLGIGENGHLAFNDPPVDFDDPQYVRVVELDEVCRMQQVHDKQFPTLDAVPKTALTLTIPTIMRIPKLILNVPGEAKAQAVRDAVEGAVTPNCPASILQKHPDVTLFLDAAAASKLRLRD